MRYLVFYWLLLPVYSMAQPALESQLKALLQKEWAQNQFSGVLLVAHRGKPVFYDAIGYRNFEKSIKLKKTDLFELASVSKQFTSMIIMKLKVEGRLQYEDTLGRYLPGLPYHGITIRHLLTHTSGLPDYQAIMDEYWDKTKIAGNPEVIAYLKQYPQTVHFQPGENYQYSNTGYLLLASIAEAVTGRDFIDLVNEWIFRPLRMKDAGFRTRQTRNAIAHFARGHIWQEEKKQYTDADSFPSSNYTIWLGQRKGPGRISASAGDLLKWDQALYSDKLIGPAELKEAFNTYTLTNGKVSNYGFGWVIHPDSALGMLVHHSGDNPGYRTHIMRYLDKRYTVILLNNNSNERMEVILGQVENLLTKY